MAQFKSLKFNYPSFNKLTGDAILLTDRLPVNVNPTAADTLDFKIPKGIEVCMIRLVIPTALDSGVGLTAKIGFVSLVASATQVVKDGVLTNNNDSAFFAAAAFGRTAGIQDLAFVPTVFEEDVYLRITPTVTATTFAAGLISAIIFGNQMGVK